MKLEINFYNMEEQINAWFVDVDTDNVVSTIFSSLDYIDMKSTKEANVIVENVLSILYGHKKDFIYSNDKYIVEYVSYN